MMNEKAKKALTDRQIWLYEYLFEAAATNPHRWVSVREIVEALHKDPYFGSPNRYVWLNNPKSHNPCPSVWADKEAINACIFVDAPILYNNYGLKLAVSWEEAEEYYTDDLIAKAKKMLWRAGVCKRKILRNGQMEIDLDENGNPTERFVQSVISDMAAEIAKESEL